MVVEEMAEEEEEEMAEEAAAKAIRERIVSGCPGRREREREEVGKKI